MQRVLQGSYILLSFFAFAVSSYISEFIGTESNLLSIAARAITLLITSFFFVVAIRSRLMEKSIDFWLFLLFWTWYTIRILYDTIVNADQLGRDPVDYWLFGLVICFLSTIPAFSKVEYSPDRIEKAVLLILLLLCSAGIYYFHFGNALEAIMRGQSRAGGNDRLNPLSYSLFSTVLISISLKRLLIGPARIHHILLLLIAISIGCYSLFLSSSRGPLLFLSIFLLLLFIQTLKAQPARTAFTLGLLVIAGWAAIVSTGVGPILREMFLDRFLSLSSETGLEESAAGRVEAYKGAFDQFISSPWVGSFLEERTIKQYPHNIILESFMAMGLGGGLLFLIIYVRYFYHCIRGLLLSNFNGLFVLALASGVLVMSSGGLAFSSDFWLCFALTSVLHAKMQSEQVEVYKPAMA